jgi:hypothetical protein
MGCPTAARDSRYETMTSTRWNIADLLDLEFFLHQDEGKDIDRLAARDRAFYTALTACREETESTLLRRWIACRKQETELVLPGSLWRELMLILCGAIAVAGLMSGTGLSFSMLAYSGTEPVNVAAYFAVFVLLQIVLFLLLGGSFLCSKLQGGSILTTSLLYRIVARLFFKVFQWILSAAERRAKGIPVAARLRWSAQIGSLKAIRQRHGLIVLRPFFLLAQMFGISFNIGVLAATLLKVIGSDLAFGWQTTLQISTESVHSAVQCLSLPWAWMAASCVPTMEQIEGSRLILKDGIYHLANRDLTSWWPFLCLSVLCYGLLPRILLLTAGISRQQWDLAAIDFKQACFRQIIHRMRTPILSAAARAEEHCGNTPEEEPFPEDRPPTASAVLPIVALIPDELFAAMRFTALQEHVRCRAGYQLCQTIPFWTLDKSEAEEIAALNAALEEQGCKDVLVVQEAWQPPVQELLAWLTMLRRAISPQPVIILALIGKPDARNILTPVQPQHLRIWRQKLAALGDSGLHVIELVQ